MQVRHALFSSNSLNKTDLKLTIYLFINEYLVIQATGRLRRVTSLMTVEEYDQCVAICRLLRPINRPSALAILRFSLRIVTYVFLIIYGKRKRRMQDSTTNGVRAIGLRHALNITNDIFVTRIAAFFRNNEIRLILISVSKDIGAVPTKGSG